MNKALRFLPLGIFILLVIVLAAGFGLDDPHKLPSQLVGQPLPQFELRDVAEQRRRIEADNAVRRSMGTETVPVDEALLAALAAGLPACAGVAAGLDRLLMAALGRSDIRDVLAFAFDADGD